MSLDKVKRHVYNFHDSLVVYLLIDLLFGSIFNLIFPARVFAYFDVTADVHNRADNAIGLII